MPGVPDEGRERGKGQAGSCMGQGRQEKSILNMVSKQDGLRMNDNGVR